MDGFLDCLLLFNVITLTCHESLVSAVKEMLIPLVCSQNQVKPNQRETMIQADVK